MYAAKKYVGQGTKNLLGSGTQESVDRAMAASGGSKLRPAELGAHLQPVVRVAAEARAGPRGDRAEQEEGRNSALARGGGGGRRGMRSRSPFTTSVAIVDDEGCLARLLQRPCWSLL
ncbi:hypothetical protein Cni_G09322 [Canna indica]|uniref:Uncharacterized protein n=1 Tax=Canna indica TaxID=4628 RepID=A0AAQ3K4C9_9LILI|nr:hypothetical protein Cni_G09322 [Canna indica]